MKGVPVDNPVNHEVADDVLTTGMYRSTVFDLGWHLG
jgi:hypothetical protein